jgi:hypothetical protein
MAKKPKVNKTIQKASDGLALLMRNKLTVMADELIAQLMRKSRKLTPARKLDALKDLTPRGVLDYKSALREAMAVVALDAITQARTEVPTKKKIQLIEQLDSVQLDEFSKLPKDLQKKLKLKADLLVGKQVGDMQKVIEFAYATAEEESDSQDLIESDINDSAIGWLNGTAMEAGASLNAASVINSARQAFFFDDQVLEEVEAFEFVNGDPVTEICQDLAGTIFSKDDPGADRYFPPLHWNCKSYVVPILIGNLGKREITKLKPSNKELEDDIQFHENSLHHSH